MTETPRRSTSSTIGEGRRSIPAMDIAPELFPEITEESDGGKDETEVAQ